MQQNIRRIIITWLQLTQLPHKNRSSTTEDTPLSWRFWPQSPMEVNFIHYCFSFSVPDAQNGTRGKAKQQRHTLALEQLPSPEHGSTYIRQPPPRPPGVTKRAKAVTSNPKGKVAWPKACAEQPAWQLAALPSRLGLDIFGCQKEQWRHLGAKCAEKAS